ncbi:Uncharacterised protein [Vibrio cholerae]|nr:Uncharacterised protein [Vibrio cholerae]
MIALDNLTDVIRLAPCLPVIDHSMHIIIRGKCTMYTNRMTGTGR